MRFEFVRAHQDQYPVRLLCRVLKVSPSGYYAWRQRPPSARAQEDAWLWPQIEKVHDESHRIYGYRRVFRALINLEIKASRRRVARLMRQHGRRGRQFRRYVVTTKPGKRLPEIPDLVQRDFVAGQPNAVWVSDITYVRTAQGWLYLAVVLDLFARRVVGWAMRPRLTQDLTTSALQMAFGMRQPPVGLIHHSDRGSQYTAHEYQRLLLAHQARPSLGRTGSCFDNAAMESFFGSLKSEWLHHQRFATREEAMSSIFYYVEVFYNRRRLHSADNYRSPADFERLNDPSNSLSYQCVH
jgi:transposase InsO family protein